MSPDGATLVAVGNFTTVAGQAREQMAMLTLAGQTATLSSWSTQRFVMQCASKFDTYIRDVDIDPTGTYVAVGTTGAFFGGVGSNTLCDSVSRWELGRTGAGQQPTWVDYAGGDTTWSVTTTGTAIYTGGHYRWYNNPYAGDTVGPGTIKRKAIAALDPVNGLPLSWNPGRSPGEGVFIMLSTPEGLWVGHDTNNIGHEYHPRLALFPIDGGPRSRRPTVATLPGELYSLPSGACPGVDPSILYRVNAAGPSLPSQDCGPDWSDDTGSSSPYRNSGSSVTTWSGVPTIDATVPTTTPPAIFGSERWDGSTSPEMQWDFPVPAGRHVPGPSVFRGSLLVHGDHRIARLRRLDRRHDDARQLGRQRRRRPQRGHDARVRRHLGRLGHDRLHARREQPGDQRDRAARPRCHADHAGRPAVDRASGFDGVTAGARVQQASSIDWSRARGAFYANGKLYYGWDDGKFYRRSFSGGSFGAAKVVATNGLVPGYFPVASVTGMFLQDGRLYYTVRGDDRLYYRYFTVESGAVGAVTFVASAPGSGFDWGSVRGLTLAGGTLYLARTDGTLWSAGWTPGLEHGSPVGGSLAPISADPAQQWAARGMFVRNP